MKATIKTGWEDAGTTGRVLGNNVFVKQWWTPILWDDEEDPSWHKTEGLVFEEECEGYSILGLKNEHKNLFRKNVQQYRESNSILD